MSTASGLPRGLEFVALSSPPHREDNPMSNTKTIPQEEPETYVLEPKEYDILLGRGTGPNIHEGNIKFRDEINARKTEYNATSNRATKSSIARTIINTVTGRFLKKLDGQEVKALKTKLSKTISKSISKSDFKEKLLKTEDIYVVVEDDFTIMEKAKQTLRQNAKLRSSPIKQSTSSPTTTTTTTITSTALREKPSGIAVIAAAAAAAAKQSPQASKSTTAAVAIDRKSTAAGASKKRPRSETEVQHLPVATAIPGPPPPAPPHVYPHMHSMKRPFRWETEKGRALMEDFKKGSPLLWGSYARMLAEKGWHDSFDEGQFSMAVQHPVEAWRKHHHGLYVQRLEREAEEGKKFKHLVDFYSKLNAVMFPHVESVWERKDDDTSHCTMILQPLEKFLRNTKIQLLFGGEFVLIEFSCTDDDSFLVPQNLMSFYQQGLLEQRRQKSSGKSTTSKNDRFRDCTFLEETNDRLKAALDKSVNELRASAKPLKQQQQQQPSQTLKTSNSSENAKSDESSNSQQAQHPVWHMLVRMPFAVKKAEPNKYIPCQSWISEYKDTYTSKITNILGFEFTMA